MHLLSPVQKSTVNTNSTSLLADIQQKCGRHNWVLQQDSDPSHTAAADTVAYLNKEKVKFIERHMWLCNSQPSRLYTVQGTLQQQVYLQRQFESDNKLKEALTPEWESSDSSIGVSTNGDSTHRPSFRTMNITWNSFSNNNVHLFCSLAFLDPRVGHTMDVLSPFISILCHSD